MKIMVLIVGAKSSYQDEELDARKSSIMKHVSPGTEIELGFPEKGVNFKRSRKRSDRSGTTEFDLTLAAPHIIKKIVEAEEKGFDAVFLVGALDPGIEAAKHAVDIPVVGPGRVVCHVAAILANRIGAIAPNDENIPYVRKMIASYGLLDMFTPIRAINIPLNEVRERKAEMKAKILELARLSLQEGAEIILPMCFVNIPIHLSAEEVSKELGVQVIDGVAVGIKFTEMLVQLGLSQSRKGYPSPGMSREEIYRALQ